MVDVPARLNPNRSLEYRRYPRKDFGHDRVWNGFQLLGAACGEIERAGLIASNNSRCFGSRSCQGHGEASRAREITAAGNGQNYGDSGDSVERLRGNNQHRAAALLLVA